MKRAIIVLFCILYSTLYAQSTINKEVMSEPGLPVIIKINSGFVEVKGTNDTTVKVTGKIGKNVESPLKIESSSGAIHVSGVNKSLFIQTITGNATIEGVFENIECQTVSGTINVTGSSDFIECSGIDGNYELMGNFPDSILKTSSGFIKLTTDYLKRESMMKIISEYSRR